MPISKAKQALYPLGWKAISRRIREERALGRCECDGECGHDHGGRCTARNGDPHPLTGSRVILTVAHLDHDPTGDDESRMKAMCQKCHLAYDADQHRASAADTRTRRAESESGQKRLF